MKAAYDKRGVLRGCGTPQAGIEGTESLIVEDPEMLELFARFQFFLGRKRGITNRVKSVASSHLFYASSVSGDCIELGACSLWLLVHGCED